jgi:K+-sensing histidine kinase KdpD
MGTGITVTTAFRTPFVRALVAVAGVVVVTAIMRVTDPQLAVAALVYVLVVVFASLLGYVPGAVAAVGSYLALNYWFTPAYESFRISRVDDLVPLLTFAFTVAVLGTTVARVNVLRRRAVEHERAAYDARVDAALNEGRAGFLSAMTHNLRTPLSSIKAAASTLRSRAGFEPPDPRTLLLDNIYGEADRLERLVTKVLELSRIRAGALAPDLESTDVGDLVRDAMHRLRHLRSDVWIRLDEQPAEVLAEVDPAMFELVVVVLLENALRFAPPGTEIQVVVRREPDANDSSPLAVVRVSDDGPGVAPAERERIFDEFVRGDTSGSGIGLTIARAICAAHGGSIALDVDSKCGATFVVTVPAER